MSHTCPCKHEMLLGEIDARTKNIEKLLSENLMPVVSSVPKLAERVAWLRMAVIGLVGILGTVQVIVAMWKP